MVIKVYVSGISGSKEVKKRQQRVLLILDSKNIKYDVIDIAEPGAEEAKDFMQNNSTSNGATISDPNPRHPLPPQLFNEDVYCGDYDQFDMANEIDEMEKFLKIEVSDAAGENLISNAEIKLKNGEVTPDEKETPQDEEKQSTEESEVKESEVVNEKDNVATEEKSKDEEVEDREEPKETEDSKENDQSKEEQKDNEELNKDETKEESGAGDEQNGDEESETKEAKADEA